MEHIFRPAESSDVDAVFLLYQKRIRWMDEKGIRQWNATGYLEAYPVDYYVKQQSAGSLYVFAANNVIIGAVVLLQADERWRDKTNSPAFYVHNLVTDAGASGVGKEILLETETMARRQGKRFARLDCAADNVFLNDYYASLGYQMVGTCQDGTYIGNRREKALL